MNSSRHFPRLQRRENYSAYNRYSEYRSEIREDCQERCVYCDMHEFACGGIQGMQIDHFKPKNHFPELEHDPCNLVWSCAPCNRLKWHSWPPIDFPDEVDGRRAFLDPFDVDRNHYFEIIPDDGSLIARQDPAQYMIERLQLNRDLLRFMRRKRDVFDKFVEFLDGIVEKSGDVADKKHWVAIRALIDELFVPY
ncbi:HNH endonuclease [Aggregatilinea lenta]|uniref:HNH endonuclease n=1 Tax=Aggregatilinea lenta TaxID=913108 RepID=UPI0013C32440|nr:HNH endonuclease [Aggregatilinea lenta]